MATTNRARLRWIAPAAALALALGAPAALTAVANADPALPEKTAEELLQDIAAAEPVPLSGTVVQQVDLGLPDLSALDVVGPGRHGHGAGPFDPMTLASGTNTWRVWTDGEEAGKLALVVDGGEYSVTYNGTDAWFWDSAAGEATHVTVPGHDATGRPGPHADHPPVSPAEFAREVLEHIEPATEVTTSGTRMVAGRAAYELLLTPQDAATKIGQVRLAVDSETSLPLWFEVTSTGGTTAVDVAFTSISFDAPDAATFTFTPPAAATVTEVPAPSAEEIEAMKDGHAGAGHPNAGHANAGHPNASHPNAGTEPTWVGEGWSTVLVLHAPDTDPAPAADEGSDSLELVFGPEGPTSGLGAVIAQLPAVSGEWGSGKLFEGTVFSALMADDGRLAIGAVGPDTLYAALTAATSAVQ